MYEANLEPSNADTATTKESDNLHVESSNEGVKCSTVNSENSSTDENTEAQSASNDVEEFAVDTSVVYPSHGVGRITGIEKQEIAGYSMELYSIEFAEDSMILRVPKARAVKAGLRALCTEEAIGEAIAILKERAQNNRGMWSKRAQDYDSKINSGDILQIAQVLRDLYRNANDDLERSYSERVVYDAALDRFIAEYSIVKELDKEESRAKILDILETASILTAAA